MKVEAQKIAIIKLGSIGDVVNTLPLLNRIRKGYPDSQIDWIVEQKAAPVLEHHPALNRRVVFPREHPTRWLQFLKHFRQTRYDLILDCQRIIKSGLLTWLSGAPWRLGFDRARCKELNWMFTNRTIRPNAHPGVMLEQFLEFADYLELPPCPISWEISLHNEERMNVNKLVGPETYAPIVLNVGASKPEKHWPVESFRTLALWLQQHWNGKIVLSGGKEDRHIATRIASSSGIENMAGALSLRELSALYETATLVISGDTGPLHLAVAMGVPVLGLYGPSNPSRTGPFNNSKNVIVGKGNPECPSCKNTCRTPYTPCMNSIPPETVFNRVEQQLSGHLAWIP